MLTPHTISSAWAGCGPATHALKPAFLHCFAWPMFALPAPTATTDHPCRHERAVIRHSLGLWGWTCGPRCRNESWTRYDGDEAMGCLVRLLQQSGMGSGLLEKPQAVSTPRQLVASLDAITSHGTSSRCHLGPGRTAVLLLGIIWILLDQHSASAQRSRALDRRASARARQCSVKHDRLHHRSL